MKWMRCRHHGREWFGALEDGMLAVHEGELFGDHRATGERVALEGVEWLMPCRPGKMLALWNNFRGDAEKNGWAVPAEPLYFVKTPNSYAAHGQAIAAVAPEVGRVAYEGELAIVIGRRAKAVSADQAAAHILGYACANDLTAIELLNRDPAFPQWTRAKGFDGFGVFGPVIETDLDLATASVRTLVGGRERQKLSARRHDLPAARAVSRLSQDMTLEPGDVILCGTSLGVLPMKPGSTIEVEIDGIGRLVARWGRDEYLARQDGDGDDCSDGDGSRKKVPTELTHRPHSYALRLARRGSMAASIEDLEEVFDIELSLEDEDEYDTIGGLVFHRLGDVPEPGDVVEVGPLVLTLESTDGRRVGKVLAVRPRDDDEARDAEADR